MTLFLGYGDFCGYVFFMGVGSLLNWTILKSITGKSVL